VEAPTEALRTLVHEHTDHSQTLFLKRPSHRLAVLLLVVAAAFAVTASGAAAKTSCGEKVIDDWYGSKTGQLSHTYPLHCYRDALTIIKHRPDLDVYSNASQDILFALQQAIAHDNDKGGAPPPDVTSSVDTADALPSWRGGPNAKDDGRAPAGVTVVPVKPVGRTDPGGVTSVLQSSSASSVPLPAIVLGGIAALLLALGSAAYLARRRQLRRNDTLRPQAESGPPNP
jgi:hypothetical protein